MTVKLKNEVRMVNVSESDTAKIAEARGHTILMLQKRIEMLMAGKPLDLCLIDSMGVTVYGNLEEVSYRIALALDKSKDIEGIFDRAGDIYEAGVDNYERPYTDEEGNVYKKCEEDCREGTLTKNKDGHIHYKDVLKHTQNGNVPLFNTLAIKQMISNKEEFLSYFDNTSKGDVEKKHACNLVLILAEILVMLDLKESENEEVFARFQAIMAMLTEPDRLDYRKEIKQDYEELTKILTVVSVKLGKEMELLKILTNSIKA